MCVSLTNLHPSPPLNLIHANTPHRTGPPRPASPPTSGPRPTPASPSRAASPRWGSRRRPHGALITWSDSTCMGPVARRRATWTIGSCSTIQEMGWRGRLDAVSLRPSRGTMWDPWRHGRWLRCCMAARGGRGALWFFFMCVMCVCYLLDSIRFFYRPQAPRCQAKQRQQGAQQGQGDELADQGRGLGGLCARPFRRLAHVGSAGGWDAGLCAVI